MTQQKANTFSLEGHAVSIRFGPNIAGPNQIDHFEVDGHVGDNKKPDSSTAIASVGTLVTFSPGPSADPVVLFSFLLPEIIVNDHGTEKFETIGFKTTVTRGGPAHQHYTYVHLKGSASFRAA
jgi:hypothetical protein